MHSQGWYEPDDFDDEFDGDDFRGGLKSALSPGEDLLWSARPGLPRIRKIAVIPALFVAVITGLSGVSLAAMLGIFEQPLASPLVLITALCLAPAVLGGFILFDLVRRMIAWAGSRWRLARTIYAVTDQRAIIAQVGSTAGELQLFSFLPGMLDGTTRFEYPDGSGDVYFEGLGRLARGPVGFFGIRAVRRVDELVRETLIDPFPHW
ncbi:hypothetical protein [Paludisphaera borealis]|uniref:DUF304 domain-containing protein n=1 Tax=Paludisphaera borealis TaxID=1387353 RepID=A0A1U7CNX3_9BACT|nr:hypothetical protein [Paludisphaera borealis]APW60621.1 hypothetical protein BSF38_02098 [Paludisphaera borealis]